MRKLTSTLTALLVLVLLASAVTASAQYPGTVLWKQECPPWATLRVNVAPTGWQGVECLSFDSAEVHSK